MKLLNVLFFCGLSLACKAQAIQDEIRPPDMRDGIKTAGPASVGIKPILLDQLTSKLKSGYYTNIHSVLIYRNGHLVYEIYLPGKDENWGTPIGFVQHGISDLHDMRSITKSVVSACVGIAISRHEIKSVDQKVFDYFKEYAALDTGLKKTITIRQLLSMTSGFKWNEDLPYDNPENSEIRMTRAADPIQYILSQPLISKPGTKWNYNGGAVQLLAYIIEKATGKPLDEYADEHLFTPLGIKSFFWHKFPGVKEPEAASGLRLSSRDALKFAILYQQNGNWQGKQILPKTWIQQSFLKSAAISPDLGYGFLFWKLYPAAAYHVPDLTVAVGNGDERLFFDNKNKLIVVVTAGNYNLPSKFFGDKNSTAILRDFVYPSFVN
ncbi:MAG: serine hydrolase domain-containing protein [Mucilaginibacter sp.]